jgi:predicted nucleic acid-binding protein
MILLDTNVISEGLRARPDIKVRAWMDAQPAENLYLCTPVVAELHYGAHLLPASARRTKLEQSISELIVAFVDRVLPFDMAAAQEYGKFVAKRDSLGRATGTMGGLIAAIAMVHGATIATRDTHGFDGIGIDLVDPFNISSEPR